MVLLIDSNVVIDRLGRREPFYSAASRVFQTGIFGDAELYISTSMLTDIVYVLTRKYGRLGAQKAMLESLEYLNVCAVSAEDGIWSLRQGWDDFEDCLVARCAENIKADYIVTRDLDGYTKSLIPAITPDALLALLEARGITYDQVDV
jgi:predicted nucleic acid-binding protein